MRMRACCVEHKQAKNPHVYFISDGKASGSGIEQCIALIDINRCVRDKGSKRHQRLMKACKGHPCNVKYSKPVQCMYNACTRMHVCERRGAYGGLRDRTMLCVAQASQAIAGPSCMKRQGHRTQRQNNVLVQPTSGNMAERRDMIDSSANLSKLSRGAL
eukprot:1153451-Pelagomonas_calceolata.AAC.2